MATYYVCSNDTPRSGKQMRGVFDTGATYVANDLVVCTRAYGTAAAKKFVHELTTKVGAGTVTAEPTWATTDNGTCTDEEENTWTARLPDNADDATYFLDYLLNSTVGVVPASGEIVYVFNTHSQSTSDAAIDLYGQNAAENRVKILCTSSFSSPALSTGATITNTGNYTISTKNSILLYGINLVQSGSTSSQTISIENSELINCELTLGSSASTLIRTNATSSKLKNCKLTFGNASQHIRCSGFTIEGQKDTYLINGTLPSTLLQMSVAADVCKVIGCNFTNCTSKILIGSGNSTGIEFFQCSLPDPITIGQPTNVSRCEVIVVDCSLGDTHYEYYKSTASGTAEDEVTVYRSGSTSSINGTTAISRKVSTDPDCKYNFPFYIDFTAHNTTVGSNVTATIYVAQASGQTRIQEGQCWLEIAAKCTSNSTIATLSDDSNSTILTQSTSDQDTDTSTWTGLTGTPVISKLTVTFTPQEVGLVRGRVYFALASKTIYVDPVLYLS